MYYLEPELWITMNHLIVGWSTYDNLTNITDADIGNILSATSCPTSTVSTRRSSISETIMETSPMDSWTLASDLTAVSCNISMVSIHETRSSSVTSGETYAGPFVLTKDDENENSTVDSTI